MSKIYCQIDFDDGEYKHGDFDNFIDACDYAESIANGRDYTVDDYESYEDYLVCIGG